MSPAELRKELLDVNRTRCVPPLPDADVERIARNIGNKPAGVAPAPVQPTSFRLYSVGELEALPSRAWLVEGVLPANSLGVLYGPSGEGKSFLVVDLALSVATGQLWCGRSVAQGPVLYVAAERFAGYGPRSRAWRDARGVDQIEELRMIGAPTLLLQEPDVQGLIAAVRMMPRRPALVLIDTLARCIPEADENSARDMGRAVQALDRIRAATGATVLVVHHTRKDGLVERGSTVLRAAADVMVSLKRSKDGIIAECGKISDAAEFEPIGLQLISQGDSCVLVSDQQVAAEASALGKNARACLQTLASLCKEGEGARYTDWRAATGLAKRPFGASQNTLLSGGYVQKAGRLYTPTEKGTEAVGQPARAVSTGLGE